LHGGRKRVRESRELNNDKEGKLILKEEKKLEAPTVYHLQYSSKTLFSSLLFSSLLFTSLPTKPNTFYSIPVT